jgi:hypothetical protein
MIIELQIRNCTGTRLSFHALGPYELELDYSTNSLPEYSVRSGRTAYMRETEMRTIMSWTPKLRHDSITGAVTNPYDRQKISGIIPCDTRQLLFLAYGIKIKLFCTFRGRQYSGIIDVYKLRNFNVVVGLTGRDGSTVFFDCCGNPLLVDENSNYQLFTLERLAAPPRDTIYVFDVNK